MNSHFLDLQGRRRRRQRLGGVQRMRCDPPHPAEEQDDHQRHHPVHHFERTRITPVGPALGAPVAGPEPPRERQGQYDDRHDQGEHDHGGVLQELVFVGGDRPAWVEDAADQTGRHGEDGFFHAPSIKCPTRDSFRFI
jgi:hypothetical protein